MSTENAPTKNPTADATGSPADAPPAAEPRSEAPVPPTAKGQQGTRLGGIARVFQVQAFQILLVLLFIYVVFSVLAPATFPGWSNQRQVIQNAAILAILDVRHGVPEVLVIGAGQAVNPEFGEPGLSSSRSIDWFLRPPSP